MKKHFLLLMLMALLPFAGFAQSNPINLEDGWAISLAPASPAYYNGTMRKPTVTLVKGNETIQSSDFDIDWGEGDWTSVNSYTITVKGDLTNTYNDLTTPTVKYFILKGTPTISTNPTANDNLQYTGSSQELVSAGTVDAFGDDQPVIEYIVSDAEPADDAAGWSENIPTATEAGTYKVWYRVPGTTNYNGVTCDEAIEVTIQGTTVSITAPSAIANLTYNGTAQTLISDATITTDGAKGTIYYKVGDDEWSTSLPQGTNAGEYIVKWKFDGTNGYESQGETAVENVSIGKATPVITPATAAENLTYNGQAQLLLNAPATATLGATVVYVIGAAENAVEFAEVKGINADDYSIVAKVVESTNFRATQADAIEVSIAPKSAAVPTAKTLTYNAQQQVLINAGEAGIVKYQLGNGEWTNSIDEIVGTNAGTYTVKYKVEDNNYKAVGATEIANVKIAKAPITIKVANVTKTFDNTTNIPEATADDFTFMTSVPGYVSEGLDFEDVTQTNAGTYEGVITTTQAAFEALDTESNVNMNYKVSVVPGTLTIEKKAIYVEAKGQNDLTTTMDSPLTLANLYDVKDAVDGADVEWEEGKAPVLYSTDAPSPLTPGSWELAFTPGTLTDGNYQMRDENPYVIADDLVYKVTAAEGSGLRISVAPGHGKVYGEADPEFMTNPVEGTDYYVTGKVDGDEITVTFSRTGGEDATDYDLTATATSANPEWYADEIQYIQGTFTISPKELTATVDKQYVTVGAENLPDPDGWSVEGLVDGDDIECLNGTLVMSETTAETAEGTITLSITNGNYTLAEGTNVGQLIVISASTLVLNTADNTLKTKIETAEGSSMNISFESKAMKQKEWYAMVLPFATTPAELVSTLGTYVVVNTFDYAKLSSDKKVLAYFKLEMDAIDAGTPFLIKPAAAVDWRTKSFSNKEISSQISPVKNEVSDKDKAIFTGTYESGKILCWGYDLDGNEAEGKKYQYLIDSDYLNLGQNKWANPKNITSPVNLKPMDAYLILNSEEAVGARVFVEDIDGNGTTAIKSLSADQVNGLNINAADGWYNLNGVKIEEPTQKGIYINNGKKVVIK